MEVLYLPAYSPDLNPDEEVFSKLKYLLKYRYQDIVFENLKYAVWFAVGDLEAADMYGYYRHAGYLMWYVFKWQNNKILYLLHRLLSLHFI